MLVKSRLKIAYLASIQMRLKTDMAVLLNKRPPQTTEVLIIETRRKVPILGNCHMFNKKLGFVLLRTGSSKHVLPLRLCILTLSLLALNRKHVNAL